MMDTDEQYRTMTNPDINTQDNAPITPIEISESYELIIPVFTKEAGIKNIWDTIHNVDLITLAFETQELYKRLKNTDSEHELLKTKFKFEDSDDVLTIKYTPRPEDELKYGKNPIIALKKYHAALYHRIKVEPIVNIAKRGLNSLLI